MAQVTAYELSLRLRRGKNTPHATLLSTFFEDVDITSVACCCAMVVFSNLCFFIRADSHVKFLITRRSQV